ncbi:MAG: VWA domain-containing protein [Bryobacteraceae bacterium]|jgi:VWFA-related protein
MRIRLLRPSVLIPFSALLLALPIIAQSPPDSVVIQSGTHIVLVNVVVKDKHGKPVGGLTRDDFVLRDNGQEQKISLFALEETGANGTPVSNLPDRLTFTNRPPPNIPAVTAFLFDELNTKLADQQLAKKDFLRYLRGLPVESRVAVFVLGDSLAMLHDFSQDMASLLAAVEKHSNRANPEVDAATAPPASSNSLAGDQKTAAQWDSFMQSNAQPYVDYTETVRATRTAAGLETIAGHLQGTPGRKTLIWISGGFPVQQGLHNTVDSIPRSNATGRTSGHSARQGGGASSGGSQSNAAPRSSGPGLSTTEVPGTALSSESDVMRAIRALNEADVAVYPVDARGVMVSPAFQADRGSNGKRSKPPKAFNGSDFNYETLDTLAVETGGLSFHHINDLSTAIQEAGVGRRHAPPRGLSPAGRATSSPKSGPARPAQAASLPYEVFIHSRSFTPWHAECSWPGHEARNGIPQIPARSGAGLAGVSPQNRVSNWHRDPHRQRATAIAGDFLGRAALGAIGLIGTERFQIGTEPVRISTNPSPAHRPPQSTRL